MTKAIRTFLKNQFVMCITKYMVILRKSEFRWRKLS
nr:MAG TPA: hypothetical protein [Bacteriophage sp.]